MVSNERVWLCDQHLRLPKLESYVYIVLERLVLGLINKDDIPILLHEALLIQQYMVHSGKICWLLKVHQLYSNAGLTYKCDMVGIENVKDHVNEIMSQYRDQYIQEWYTRINRTDSRK